MSHPPKTQALLQQLEQAVRRLCARQAMFSEAVAAHFGLSSTELECLDLIFLRSQVTPSELSRATGLTSGAMTALLDRMEAAGYVLREPDSQDRRRVLLRVRPAAIKHVAQVQEGLQQAMHALWSRYSVEELELIIDFATRSAEAAMACTEEIAAKRRGGRAK